jgi:energy-coupling factor transporter transmembrane protein EcfT
MTSPLAQVDDWAARGSSLWHRASALAKFAFAGLVLFTVLTSPSPWGLFAIWLGLVVLVGLAGVPIGPAILLGTYPALFSIVFVLSRWDGTWQTPAVLLLRSLASSQLAVLLVSTTPYPDLFAPLSRVLPRLVGDGLFLTYRAFFQLERMGQALWTAFRLRGGLTGRGLPRDLRHAGEGLGQLVVHSFDRSQRLYAVMQLRGHAGRVCGCRHWADFAREDWVPLSLGVATLVLGLVLGAQR